MNPYIKPIGVGDLMVTKQRLVRLEYGEVAHVENIMARELRMREHKRRRYTETATEEESESSRETEEDLQTTERFETSAEAKQVLKSQSALSAGLDLSASYGPVSLSVFANYSSTNSREDSREKSTKYAKEVTERALSRIQEKVRLKQSTRIIEEILETNKHGFDNRTSSSNESGIYRWIDKYYLNKVFNYGKRLMLEFYIPEPAAFYLFANNPDNVGELPKKPVPPKDPETGHPLKIEHVNRGNYKALANQYGADSVEPPPTQYKYVSTAIAKKWTKPLEIGAYVMEDLEIPEGYYAWYIALATGDLGYYPNPTGYFYNIKIGSSSFRANTLSGIHLSGQTGRLPIAVTTANVSIASISTELWCRPLRATLDRWQLNTYNTIMSGYQKAIQDYEDKMAAIAIQAGVKIQGNNPNVNRLIEQDELKKGCITLLKAGEIDMRPAVLHDPDAEHPENYPSMEFGGSILNSFSIKFFEEAFEWNNITYEFFPYFWGRRPEWVNLLSSSNKDPVFEKFLQAGAAKVIVPVDLKCTKSVLFYLMTGRTVFNQRIIPQLSSLTHPYADLYNTYLEDLEDEGDIVGIEENQDIREDDEDVWKIKVPTNLVALQQDSNFPIDIP